MGREALLESLRAKAAEDREALWRDARSAAERHRAELARAAEAERARIANEAVVLAERLTTEAEGEARRQARGERTAAALELAGRCRRWARAALPALRESGGAALFARLGDELPPLRWLRVAVHPDDAGRAHERYPEAEVVTDAGISGGLLVETDGARVRVNNTLDARLDAAWPDLLPALLAAATTEVHDGHAAA